MRRFLPSDLPEINAWYAARGLPEMVADGLPEIGCLVPATAAGFLYTTGKGGIGILDAFVTNPEAKRWQRHEAILAIIDELNVAARERGITRLIALTKVRGIVKLGNRLGFKSAGAHQVLWRIGT